MSLSYIWRDRPRKLEVALTAHNSTDNRTLMRNNTRIFAEANYQLEVNILTTSWVINQYFRGVKCLAQGHNTAAVGFEPRSERSWVRNLPPPCCVLEQDTLLPESTG